MKKKLLMIAMSLCMVLTCMPQTLGTAFAAETGSDTTVSEPQPAADREGHDCGYHRPEGIGTPIERIDAASKPARRQAAVYNSNKNLEEEANANPYVLGRKELVDGVATGVKKAKLLWAYDRIAAGIETLAKKISVYQEGEYELTEAELEEVYNRVKDDHPEYFWLNIGYEYSYFQGTDPVIVGEISPEYLVNSETDLQAKKDEFNSAVQTAFAEVQSNSTQYEQELWLHDYLVMNNDYVSYSKFAHTAYGALVEGECVCEGYTRAFQLLLNKLGIENYPISGSDTEEAEQANHIWNMVKLDNEWYQVDITWDDNGNNPEDVYYAYFNITASEMQKDHTFVGNYVNLPECNGTEYFYFNQKDNSHMVFNAQGIDKNQFINELTTQMGQKGFARIYAPNDSSDSLAEMKLWELYGDDDAGIHSGVAANFIGPGKSYSIDCDYAGHLEYHFYMYKAGTPEKKEFYGNLIQGRKNLDDVKIRMYGSDAEIAEALNKESGASITDKERLDFIEEAILKHRKEDTACKGSAEKDVTDTDEGWYFDIGHDENGNEEKRGTYYTQFKFRKLPVGSYNLAIYKEGYGLWVYGIEIGEYGTNKDDVDNEKCWWPVYTLGDLDDNCIVDSSDAIFLQRYIAKWPNYRENGNWYAADINNDEKVDSADLMILQRHLARWTDFENLEDYENGNKQLTNTQNAA